MTVGIAGIMMESQHATARLSEHSNRSIASAWQWNLEGEAGVMHDTGIVRRVDDLGRIVIPMELRRTLGINVKDPMAIYVEGERIILTKHKDSCAICGATDAETTMVKARPVCADCVAAIKKN
jgi:transcriptional pleiotropic regulator of transition state genes